jgi:SAM-dependent methyltransferase
MRQGLVEPWQIARRGSTVALPMVDPKQHAPATLRNREPIREVLARELPAHGTVLEIASGTGEHAVAFAAAFPQLAWQPSDPSRAALASIAAWRAGAQLANLRAPIELDASAAAWPIAQADAIVCINMVHISPWQATLGLFAGAARVLPPGGLLYLYGPFRFAGAALAASNAEFDRSLRARDPRWGVRDVDDVVAAAAGFTLREAIAMPANNHSLVFRGPGG